ncbi:hypothetical protein BGX27_007464 [Mortierella sp. AM989]|nr:hypothetical protein BGX27_007464 [Mortierella sp. AM989]
MQRGHSHHENAAVLDSLLFWIHNSPFRILPFLPKEKATNPTQKIFPSASYFPSSWTTIVFGPNNSTKTTEQRYIAALAFSVLLIFIFWYSCNPFKKSVPVQPPPAAKNLKKATSIPARKTKGTMSRQHTTNTTTSSPGRGSIRTSQPASLSQSEVSGLELQKLKHNEAYDLVHSALNHDTNGNYTEALECYKKGVVILKEALKIRYTTDVEFRESEILGPKLRQNLQAVETRLQELTHKLSELNNPNARPDPDAAQNGSGVSSKSYFSSAVSSAIQAVGSVISVGDRNPGLSPTERSGATAHSRSLQSSPTPQRRIPQNFGHSGNDEPVFNVVTAPKPAIATSYRRTQPNNSVGHSSTNSSGAGSRSASHGSPSRGIGGTARPGMITGARKKPAGSAAGAPTTNGQPSVLSDTRSKISRLKNIDTKLANMILNEVLIDGATVTWDDIGEEPDVFDAS